MLVLLLSLACRSSDTDGTGDRHVLDSGGAEGDPSDDTGGGEAAACAVPGIRVVGDQLCVNGAPGRLVGANGMHVFGPGSADMAGWGLRLSREFIGNMDQQPIDGGPIQDRHGSWLHPLRDVVDDNRASGLVTLLSPMGWDGIDLIYAEEPSEVEWRSPYDARLYAMAAAFAGDPDVWISVWNEPYTWTGEGFEPERWLDDMNGLVALVRSAGFDGVVAVPGSHMGQGADVWVTHGGALEDPAQNHIFDLHAYERWLIDQSPEEAASVLAQVDAAGLCWMVGEVAPVNAGATMDPRPFLSLEAVQARTVSAWLWKYSDTDPDALLRLDGTPNDEGNFAWGTSYRALAAGEELSGG